MRPCCPVLALALALAACGRSATPSECPGDVQGSFRLRATLAGDAGERAAAEACARAVRIPVEPVAAAAVSFTGPAEAALCPERVLAAPLVGSRAGDALEVAGAPEAAALAGCSCAAQVTERVTGTLERDARGAAAAFAGELVGEVALRDPAGCVARDAAEAAACAAAPCRVRWTLAAP